jgi:hypothetical protein
MVEKLYAKPEQMFIESLVSTPLVIRYYFCNEGNGATSTELDLCSFIVA